MFDPTRDQSRAFLFDLWAKHIAGAPLTGLESMALAIVVEHPEYHAVLADRERYSEREWTPEGGQTNPFLHMMMHVAIEEQLSIDQPRGIRGRYQALVASLQSEHHAKHRIFECLTETMWQAQRNRVAFDESVYFDCLERFAEG